MSTAAIPAWLQAVEQASGMQQKGRNRHKSARPESHIQKLARHVQSDKVLKSQPAFYILHKTLCISVEYMTTQI